MRKQYSNKKQDISLGAAVGIGTIVSVLVGLLGALIGSVLINRNVLQESSVAFVTIITWFAGSMIGSLLASSMQKSKHFIAGLITAVCFFLLCIATCILLFDSNFGEVWQGVLSIAAGVLPATMLNLRGQRGNKKKFKYKM